MLSQYIIEIASSQVKATPGKPIKLFQTIVIASFCKQNNADTDDNGASWNSKRRNPLFAINFPPCQIRIAEVKLNIVSS